MKIAVMDTTNFDDFPVADQSSSIKNFLNYAKEQEKTLSNLY